jgi:hypothetical protein
VLQQAFAQKLNDLARVGQGLFSGDERAIGPGDSITTGLQLTGWAISDT